MVARTTLLIVLLSGVPALGEDVSTCAVSGKGCLALPAVDMEAFEMVEVGISQFELLQRKINQNMAGIPAVQHVLQIGEKVVAKWPAYRDQTADPWFAGIVKAITAEGDRCSINYEDGDFSSDVKENEVLYAPTRPALWGKGDLRGNDLTPDDAEKIIFKGVYNLVDNNVHCNDDSAAKYIGLCSGAATLADCQSKCDATPGCMYVSWVPYSPDWSSNYGNMYKECETTAHTGRDVYMRAPPALL